MTYSIQDAAQGHRSLLVRASQRNYTLVQHAQKMLPIVVHGDWLDVREIWVVESDEHLAQTYVTLDEKHPFIDFKGKQAQSENVFVVIPNVVNVDYVENVIDESALIGSNRLCKQVDDHEAVTIDECEHCSSVDINKSIMRNRLCRNYVQYIDHLTSSGVQVAFKKFLEEELSEPQMLTYKRNNLQQQWSGIESERDPDVMDQYRNMKSWFKSRLFGS